MDEGVNNHIPLDGTTGSRQILMDECNPSLDILDGESTPHGVQTSPVAMEEDVPLMVGSHDSGRGTSVTRPFSLSSPMTTVMLLLFLLLCTTNSATAAAVESAAGGDHRLAPGNNGGCGGFKRMFSFGDSITDAGNLATISPPDASFNRLPYGETFFGHPTGRFCDGRLIVDFLAEGLGLPFLTPFLRAKTPEDFRQGANFAVAGATALSQDFFKKMGLDLTIIPPFSLDVQLEWFKSVLNSLGSTDQERKEIMSKSLFLMGEVGGNDYNHPFFQNRSFTNEIKPLVPKVIAKIENAIKVLIDLGAKTIVVPGNFPIGCVPRYLTMFQSKSSPQDYDEFGCIKWLNDFSVYHNRALKRMLHQIHHDSTVSILYGDYYNTALEITHHPAAYGFKKETALVACCGDGGPYNSNSLFGCGGPSTNLCTNPSTHISWDGLHLTEAAYKFVAYHMLHGPYAHQPSISPK